MSEELKPCQHGRNFCMECHYDSKSPQQRLDDANATIAELRAELDGERNMAARHQRTVDRLKRELDALRGQEAVGEVVERNDGKSVQFDGVLYASAILMDLVPPGTRLYAAPIAKEKGEWIACAERLPVVDEVVMAYEPGAVPEFVAVKWMALPEWSGFVYVDEALADLVPGGARITHWRPLPAAPSRQDA